MTKKTDIINSICDALAGNDIKTARAKLLAEWKFIPPQFQTKREGISQSLQLDIFFRDRFTCRYCGKLTIFIGTLRIMSLMMPDEFPYHPNWKWERTHPAYWELTASCDHLLPVARGGGNDIENLVTACYMCNSIKANWTLQELRWELKEINNPTWDGLTGYFLQLMEQNNIKNRALNDFYRALKNRRA